MATTSSLYLGAARRLQDANSAPLFVPAHHLVTLGVVVGMTGSGKTGLVTVMVEEALRSGIPVLAFDVKGDLPNLLLAFPSFSPPITYGLAFCHDRPEPRAFGGRHRIGDCQ